MSKVTVNRGSILRKIQEKLKEVEGATQSDLLLGEIGARLLKDTQARARTGKGFTAETVKVFGSPRVSLPGLADSTIDSRRTLATTNQTPAFYREKKSNLTLTGQLLDSLKLFIRRGSLIIRPDGARRPYRTKKGAGKGQPTNDKLAEFLEDKGFYFLGVDDKSLNQIKTISIRFIRRLLTKR
jgi:hypothetical protein